MKQTLQEISHKLWQVGDLLSAYDRGYGVDTVWSNISSLELEVLDLYESLPEEIQQRIPRLILLKEGKIDVILAWSFGVDEIKELLEGMG